MEIKYAQTLEAVQYKNKTFLCQIRVLPRAVNYFHGQKTPYLTHRWMQPEYWTRFDAGLEQILERYEAGKLKDLDEVDETFPINALVQVCVRPASTPVEALCCCSSKSELKAIDVAGALECVIEHGADARNNGEYKRNAAAVRKLADKPVEEDDKVQEYKPRPILAQKQSNLIKKLAEYEPQADNLLGYVPYTPSAIGDSNVVRPDDEPYALTKVSDGSGRSRPYSSEAAVYKATPIKLKKTKFSTENDSNSKSDGIRKADAGGEEKHARQRKETVSKRNESGKKKMSDLREKGRKSERIAAAEENESESEYFQKRTEFKTKRSKSEISVLDIGSPENGNAEERLGSPCSDTSHNSKSGYRHVLTPMPEPRRSPRCRFKPTRLIEEKSDDLMVTKKSTPKKRHENLFGSDDDDVEAEYAAVQADFVKNTAKVNAESKPTETCPKSKRKREPTKDYNQEKGTIGRWLSKDSFAVDADKRKSKPSAVASVAKKSRHPLSDGLQSPPPKSTTETEKTQTLKAMLEQLVGPSPKKVDTLSLDKLNLDKILKSFVNYKSTLDKIYYQLRNKGHIRGHNGIDHFLVISLIDHDIQLQMMHKLKEIYDKSSVGSSGSTTMFANAMLPEWIICLFMEEHNFTRDEAISQIKAQEDYRLYVQAQSDNPF